MSIQKIVLSLVVFLLFTITVSAQSIAETSFKELIEKLPQPPAGFQQAYDQYRNLAPGEKPAEYRVVLEDVDQLKKQVLQSLFDRLQTNLNRSNTDKSYRASLSPDEQKMLRDFATLKTSWGEGAFYGFNAWIEYRPGISKQSWTRINKPMGAEAQSMYQQLLQLEKQLNWPLFMEEAHDREQLIQNEPKIDALTQQLSTDLAAVPTRKVKFAEGSDVMVDMQDPGKAIAVLKKFAAKADLAYTQCYDERYKWWRDNFTRVQMVAVKFDELLTKTNYGASLTGNDQQLKPVIADVQARILGMLYHITNIGTNVVAVTTQFKLSKAMVEESINSFKKFPTQ